MIKNCLVTMEDIEVCEKIFGLDIYTLKGKTIRLKLKAVVNDYVKIPKDLLKTHQDVELCANIMYIQGVVFLVIVSRHIHLISIINLTERKKSALAKAFDQVFCMYNKAGFYIWKLYMDQEFKVLTDNMADNNIDVNPATVQEHVPEVEQVIRTIKD